MAKLWPFSPVYEITETLSWSTDVLETYTGEMRFSHRAARQQLEMTFPLLSPHWAVAKFLYR